MGTGEFHNLRGMLSQLFAGLSSRRFVDFKKVAYTKNPWKCPATMGAYWKDLSLDTYLLITSVTAGQTTASFLV